MKSRVLPTFAFILGTMMSASQGWAACTAADFTNKTWMVTATEVTDGVLFFCKLNVNGAGTVSALTNGCADSRPGQTSFNSATKYNINSGTVKLVNAADCTFDINVKFANGSPSAVARVVMDSGKTVATGNFLVSWGGGGSWNVVRLK